MCIEKMIDEMSDACYTMDNNQHCEVHHEKQTASVSNHKQNDR